MSSRQARPPPGSRTPGTPSTVPPIRSPGRRRRRGSDREQNDAARSGADRRGRSGNSSRSSPCQPAALNLRRRRSRSRKAAKRRSSRLRNRSSSSSSSSVPDRSWRDAASYEVSLLLRRDDGSELEDPLPQVLLPAELGGSRLVPHVRSWPGRAYSLQVRNRTGRHVACTVYVDGRNAILENGDLIVAPRASRRLPGFVTAKKYVGKEFVKEYRDFVFAKPKISEEEQGQHTLAAADTEGRPDKNYTDFGRIVVEIWDCETEDEVDAEDPRMLGNAFNYALLDSREEDLESRAVPERKKAHMVYSSLTAYGQAGERVINSTKGKWYVRGTRKWETLEVRYREAYSLALLQGSAPGALPKMESGASSSGLAGRFRNSGRRNVAPKEEVTVKREDAPRIKKEEPQSSEQRSCLAKKEEPGQLKREKKEELEEGPREVKHESPAAKRWAVAMKRKKEESEEEGLRVKKEERSQSTSRRERSKKETASPQHHAPSGSPSVSELKSEVVENQKATIDAGGEVGNEEEGLEDEEDEEGDDEDGGSSGVESVPHVHRKVETCDLTYDSENETQGIWSYTEAR